MQLRRGISIKQHFLLASNVSVKIDWYKRHDILKIVFYLPQKDVCFYMYTARRRTVVAEPAGIGMTWSKVEREAQDRSK